MTGSGKSPPWCMEVYLWPWESSGPNWACCFARLLVSAGEGGWKRVVGGSSMFAESAVAVDREIVGNDSEAVLIGGEVELRNACSCWRLAASSAAAADWASFDLGDVEKNCAILDAFADVDLTRLPPFSLTFSLKAGKGGKGEGGELLLKGFDTR